MKIKYHEWKCVGCENILRFTGEDILAPVLDWFTIKTEGHRSSSERPRFNTSVCSISCLEKVSVIIDDLIKKHRRSIPNKKHIEATICDYCAKIVKIDTLTQIYGPGPLQEWRYEKNPDGRKDFCSGECKKNHTLDSTKSVLLNLNCEDPFVASRIIQIIDSPNFKEEIKALENNFGNHMKPTEYPLSF